MAPASCFVFKSLSAVSLQIWWVWWAVLHLLAIMSSTLVRMFVISVAPQQSHHQAEHVSVSRIDHHKALQHFTIQPTFLPKICFLWSLACSCDQSAVKMWCVVGIFEEIKKCVLHQKHSQIICQAGKGWIWLGWQRFLCHSASRIIDKFAFAACSPGRCPCIICGRSKGHATSSTCCRGAVEFGWNHDHHSS